MKARSIRGKTADDIAAALGQVKADGYMPTLAIVFMPIDKDRVSLCTLLDTHGIAIFGATTSAQFSDLGVDTEGIVLLLLDIHPDYFRIELQEFGNGQVYEAAVKLGEAGKQAFAHPAFIISMANFKASGEEVIRGLTDIAGEDVSIVGGVAGEPVNFQGFVFTKNESSANGIISLIIDLDRITVKGLAVSGWKAMGTEKKVTHSEGSWIYTIDDKPAIEVIQKFIGNAAYGDSQSADIVKLNLTYPLQFSRPGGSPKMLPTVLLNKVDQWVMIGGSFSQGSSFRFSLPPDFDVVDMVIESSKQVKETDMPDADALLVFSCVGRLESLGPMAEMEVGGLAEVWKKPMIGFFSLGEFGRVPEGKPEFHGTTVSWVALKEIPT